MPPQYFLVASAALDVFAISSAIVFIFSRQTRIELPTADSYEELEGLGNDVRKDPFDVVESEDVIDGHLLDEEKFWTQV
jgi:hypothetical protein